MFKKLKFKYFRHIDFSDEKTKDFIAGLIALIFVVTAGYLALNRFNNPIDKKLGTGGRNGQIETKENNDKSSDKRIVAGTSSENKWVATDYKKGDIKAGSYTVKEGDTLWEISEAVYGNGNMWHSILDANSDNIGYLPNGSQALIVTGQTLVLP